MFGLNATLVSSKVSSRDTAHVSRIVSTSVPTVSFTATSTATSRGRFGIALAESTTSTRTETRSRGSGSPGRIIGNTSTYLDVQPFAANWPPVVFSRFKSPKCAPVSFMRSCKYLHIVSWFEHRTPNRAPRPSFASSVAAVNPPRSATGTFTTPSRETDGSVAGSGIFVITGGRTAVSFARMGFGTSGSASGIAWGRGTAAAAPPAAGAAFEPGTFPARAAAPPDWMRRRMASHWCVPAFASQWIAQSRHGACTSQQ